MRIPVPLAHVLQSSRGVSDIFKHQKTQIPLLAALEDGASSLDSHPIVVIGVCLHARLVLIITYTYRMR